MKRAQVFSLDFIAAVLIFIIIFGALLIAWDSVIDNIIKNSERKDMEIYANRIVDFFVSNGGHPSNWIDSPENVSTIGLAVTDRVIDSEKLNAFIAMDYEKAREKMRISGYNFYFRIVNAGIEKGIYDNSGIISYSSRAIICNGRPDVMELFIWRYS